MTANECKDNTMPPQKMILKSLLHALAVAVYIILVSLLMNNANRIFGAMDNFWGPVALLLLFTVSAAVTGLLVMGRPAYLFLNGQKKEGLQFLFYTLGWLVILTVIVFVIILFNY
jgi:hypothetical protein